ncbi:MAG: DUF262 domain-containing protein [Nanoarchaeota archaeon]
MLFKDADYNLNKLTEDINVGVIGLPDIQRPFVWKDTQVRDLFDSMYRGYPVGYLLFWENGHQEHTRTIGDRTEQRRPPRFLIVDGQQRLTSIFAVIKGREVVRENYEKERIIIAFNPLTEKFEIPDASTPNNPEYIQDISKVWSTTNISRFITEYTDKLREAREIKNEEEDKIASAIGELHGLLHFPFSALEIDASASEEEVAEIFVRINSKGKQLKETDFILTLMSVFWDDGRMQLENFARKAKAPSEDRATPFNYVFQPNPDQMLRVAVGLGFKRGRMKYAYSILRGKDLQTEEFSDERRIQQFEILKEAQEKTLNLNNWHEFLKALKEAGYTRASLISSDYNIMYSYVLYLIGKYDFGMDNSALRKLTARWFYFSSLTGRYTSSAETQMEEDLNAIEKGRSLMGAVTLGETVLGGETLEMILNKIINTEITPDYWGITLPTSGLVSAAARNPATFAYYAALNILGARVLFSNLTTIQLMESGVRERRSALERHHLFPKKYLERIGVDDRTEINQVANYALVEWGDNNKISDNKPSEYLPEYVGRFSSEENKQMYYWHALPEGWEQMEFPKFLEERRKRMASVIRDAFDKLK